MNRTLLPLILVAGLWLPGTALALSTDRDEPMEIEADSAELDDRTRITIYRGDVIVKQGTMLITGDKLTIYYDENEDLDHAIMDGLDGNLAYYRQLPDDSEVHDEAWARRMEFYDESGIILLIRDAKFVRDNVVLTGDRIEHDTVNSRVISTGRTRTVVDPDAEATPTEEDGRARVILTPRKRSTE